LSAHLVWMDLEMTGLDPKVERIIEIATIVTDSDLNTIAEGPVLTIRQPQSLFDAMDDWQLGFKNTGQPPVYLAAHGPKLLDFARRRTDGAFMYLSTSEYLAQAASLLQGKALLIMQPVAVADDLDEARHMARRAVRIYTDLPNYQRAWKAQGFTAADYEDGPSDRLLDALIALGPLDRVRAKLAERRTAGATGIIVIPLNLDEQRAPDWTVLAAVLHNELTVTA